MGHSGPTAGLKKKPGAWCTGCLLYTSIGQDLLLWATQRQEAKAKWTLSFDKAQAHLNRLGVIDKAHGRLEMSE